MKTPASLLARLRDPQDQQAWDQFVELYTPMLLKWFRQQGLATSDAADCVQETLITIVRRMKHFEYDVQGSFRGWLKTVATNKVRDLRARSQRIRTTEARAAGTLHSNDNVDVFAEQEYRTYLITRALHLIEQDFDPQTCRIFRESMLRERSPQEIADEFGVTRNVVYLARSRILRRLRQRLDRLMD